MMPTTPNMIMPPRVPKRIISSCIWVSLPTRMGRSRLSMLPTTAAQNTPRPMALARCPVAARIITAGTHTSAVPMPGIKDSTAIMVPQNTALSIPTTAKAAPANPPCRMPITAVPFRVARVTDVNLSSMRRSS